LDKLPVCKSYKGYDEIMLTGGEPTLKLELLRDTISDIRKHNPVARIYVYTSNIFFILNILVDWVDGVTLTLHNNRDSSLLQTFESTMPCLDLLINPCAKNIITAHVPKSLRLNVFRGVRVPELRNDWIIKKDIVWIKNCPLPKDEIFMRL
jgi:hypothetical protein